MIDILRIINGTETIVCRVATNDASVVNEIMGREEVTVNTTVESPLPVEAGDFIRIDGTVYTLNREPDFGKTSDVEYRYNLLFESPLYRMLDKLFTNPLTGISKFGVSRTLVEFVRLITENMNKIDSGWSVAGDIPASEPKNLTFDAVSCREVLNRLSGEFGVEYYLNGKTIYFTERIENITNLVFEQGKGKGLYSIGQEPVDSENTVTRIFPYGGTQNMAPGKGDVNGRLFLPEGYLENFSEYGKVVEKEVEFQDVFPRFTGSVDSVSGEFNKVIRCAAINFNVEKQAVGGTPVKINFLSGDLMGESFEFGWDYPTKTVTLKPKEDENNQADKDGKKTLIPHALKKAEAGDSFNFTDLVMPNEYMASAILDLRAKATEWLAYYSRSRVKYSLEVDHRYLRGKRTLKAGDLVTIKIPETGTEKLLRIISAERNLNTGRLTCTVSNYLDEKWSKKIEGAISDLKSNVTGSGSGSGLKIDIIKENDITPATDLNIYSSKRSVKEIGDKLSRVKADSAEEHITFKKGITVEGGTITDTLTASGKVVVSDLEAGNNIKSKTAEVSEKAVAGALQVKGSATAFDMEITNHIKSKTVEATGKVQAGELEVTGNTKLSSLNVSGKTVTGTIDVAGLSKSGNAEVVNLSQTKDLVVTELARTRDLVVTRLAEVLNLSVTEVATLARTIVKESVSSETFIPGFAGEGFKIWQLAGGVWTGEFDSITIRKTLTAFELLISKIRAVKGSLAITQANGKIKKVLDQSLVYSLEIEDTMSFVSGDLVRCQTWQTTGSIYYWVTVVRVEGNSIICNKAEFNGIVPVEGDELVQMGNVSDSTRQSMVYLDASSGRPAIDVLSGINTKSFAGKLKVRLGCLDGITDTDFPSDMQPSGYGLYCTNGFFKGMFVLRSGKTVEDYTGELVDTIQIGVRNLVKNSTVNMTSNGYGFGHRWLTKYLEPGKTYTLVANGRVDEQTLADNKHLLVSLYNQGWNQFKELTFNSLTDETKHITFTLSKTAPVPTAISSFLYPNGGSRTGQVTVNWYMLFEGNKAPDNWIEAPEDTSEKIQEAKNAADKAQTDATSAKSIADAATVRLNDWAADGSISPVEKFALKQEQKALTDEKTQIVSDAIKYSISSTAYVTAFTNYNAELTYHTAAMPENIIIRASFATNQTVYYTAKQTVLNAIATAAKKLATDAQAGADRANGAITDIKTELSAIPGKITAAVTSEMNGIQIGGVNLLNDSANERTSSVEYVGVAITDIAKNNLGKMVTISADVKAAVAGPVTIYTLGKYQTGAWNSYTLEANIYTRVYATGVFSYNPTGAGGEVCTLSFYGTYNTGRMLTVKNIKVEEGNKATAWTPSLEDSAAVLEVVRTELDSRLTVTEQNITQKVSQSDFNVLGQRVGTAEASIKTQADKIALTVTKEEFDNLQMSGRNVLRTSGNFIDFPSIADFWADNGGGCAIDTDVLFNGHNTILSFVGNGIHGIWYKLENGVEYTYSAMIRSNENYTGDGVTPLHYWAGKDNAHQNKFRVVKYDTSLVAGVWKLVYVTFKLISDANSFYPFIYAHGNGTRVFNIAFMCLTKGNVPMINWEPAIEDVNDTIAKQEARIVLTEDGITSQANSINNLAGRMNTAEQKITPYAITMTVRDNIKVGSRNYLYGSRLDNLDGWATAGGTVSLVTDEKMGVVVEYSRPAGGGDYMKVFKSPITELANTDLVYFVIVKNTSASGAWAFGGWSATVNKLTSASSTIDLGNGWYQYWVTFKSGDTVGDIIGINSVSGTWRFYAAGVLKGTAPTDWTPAPEDRPTFDEIESEFQQTANGFKLRGKEISLLGKVTFGMLAPDSQATINGKATTGYVDTAKDAAIIASRNNVAEKMGYINYADMEAKAIAGQSIITGGKIRTILIDADAIVTDALVTRHIDADYIQGKTLNFTKGTIGGWSIDADSLYSGVKAADSTYATLGMTIRSNGSISSKNFRIDKDGNVFGRDCEFTDGRFTGTVTATKGRIGGFEISGGSLVHTTGDTVMVEEHLFLDTTGISFIYRDKNSYTKKEIFAGFGIGSGPSTLGLPVPLWVDHEVKKGATTTICYASFFSARGAADPYNNIAIALGSGCISGLAVKVRIITGSDNISHDDVFIKGSESGTYDPTVTLPWNPTVGKVIITCNGSRKITIAMSSHYIRVNGANHTAMTVGGGTRMAIFIFDGTYWNYNYLNI